MKSALSTEMRSIPYIANRRLGLSWLKYWERRRGLESYPLFANVSLDDIPKFAPYMFTLALNTGPEGPTLQFVGAELECECGSDVTNKGLSGLPPQSLLARVIQQRSEVISDRNSATVSGQFSDMQGREILYRAAMLPFSSLGNKIDYIVGVITWTAILSGAALGKSDLELVEEIKSELKQSNDCRLNAAIKMAEAHDLVSNDDPEADGMGWEKFATNHFDLSRSEIKKLVKIGKSEDPKAALAAERKKTRQSVAKSRKSISKKNSYVGATAGPGAAWGSDRAKPIDEMGGPEPGTPEQQRDRVIRMYEAVSDEAKNLFDQWWAEKDENDALPRDLPVKREAMKLLPAPAQQATA